MANDGRPSEDLIEKIKAADDSVLEANEVDGPWEVDSGTQEVYPARLGLAEYKRRLAAAAKVQE